MQRKSNNPYTGCLEINPFAIRKRIGDMDNYQATFSFGRAEWIFLFHSQL